MAFSVEGKRVTVAGAARSGIAAAELLARRGAAVTLSDIGPRIEAAEPLRALGVELELGGHRATTFADADLVVLSPGVPPELKAGMRAVVTLGDGDEANTAVELRYSEVAAAKR